MVEIAKSAELDDLLSENGRVLIDFWAPWCGPCRMLAAVLDDVEASVIGLLIAKVNADENQELAARYDVQTLPTLILFENGQEARSRVGFASASALIEWIG